jgi:hypothetical protein
MKKFAFGFFSFGEGSPMVFKKCNKRLFCIGMYSYVTRI